jgi:hypothetical protein
VKLRRAPSRITHPIPDHVQYFKYSKLTQVLVFISIGAAYPKSTHSIPFEGPEK